MRLTKREATGRQQGALLKLALARHPVGEPKVGQCMGLPETGAVPDWCHSSLSITNFVLCEPEKKNYPLIKTLVSPLTYQSQTGDLSTAEEEYCFLPYLHFFAIFNDF